jgi:hypothetical protein
LVTISTEGRRILKLQEEINGEEKRILDLLGRGLSQDFPNPQRVGCPASAMLKGLALHKVPLAEADPWLDHFSACSPCFQEFSQFRKQALDRRRSTQVWLAAAAVLLFAAAGRLWVRTAAQGQRTAIVILDLRERSLARGENPAVTKPLALELPRTAKHLVMDLPIGSQEGSYDLALLNEAGEEVSRATGRATLENQVVILRADIDIGDVNPGSYFLGVRQPGLEWSRYPARVI